MYDDWARLTVTVDKDGEPTDHDRALASFLLSLVGTEMVFSGEKGYQPLECEFCGQREAEHFQDTAYGERHLCGECPHTGDKVDKPEADDAE